MPAGRPSKYKPEFGDVIIELGKKGQAVAEMASALDIHKDTLYEWAKVHPEFSDALSKAIGYSEAWWSKTCQASLHNKDTVAPLLIFNMKARFGWRDKPAEESEKDESAPDPIELATRIASILTTGGAGAAGQADEPHSVEPKPRRRGRPPKSPATGNQD